MFEPHVSTLASHLDRAARSAGPGAVLPGLVAAGLLLAPVALDAQDDDPLGPSTGSVSVTARGGVGIPVDAHQLNAITRTGGSVGGGVSFHVSPVLALTADVDYQLLQGKDEVLSTGTRVPFPDMDVLHATGGLEVHFTSPETRWTGVLSFGGGISNLNMAEATDDGSPPPGNLSDVDLTGASFRAGAELGYRATDAATVFVEPGVYLLAVDREETRKISDNAPHLNDPFDVAWIIPLQAGVRIGF